MDSAVRNVLRLGTYQIAFTRIPAYAACDSSVNLVRNLGSVRAAGFVNGVLRAVVRGLDDVAYPDPESEPERWISVMESHPLWMVRWHMGRFGFDETLRWCRANNRRPEPELRVNRLKTSPANLPEETFPPCEFAPHGVTYRGGGNPADREEYRRGLYSIQSQASQLLTLAAAPAPGNAILDGCAGRGGKSTYLAELCDDRCRILSVDNHKDKLQFLESEAGRLGISCIEALAADLSRLKPDEDMDLVLLDVPCSGLGTIGREADARWHKSEQLLVDMPRIQGNLIRAAARWVKPGGLLLYATCSVAPEENEEVTEAFVRGDSDFYPVGINPDLPGVSGHRMNLLPQEHGTDGAYAALFKRR